MKEIINNKKYDTTTALILGSKDNENMYKTKNGTYFKTNYDGITPLTNDEAKEWLGKVDADMYIKEFGDVEEA